MSDLLEVFRSRRSIRKYVSEPIPDEKIEKVIQAGLLSPSAKNLKPWELIVIRDKNMLKKMSECHVRAAKMLAGADCAIVVLQVEGQSDTLIEDSSIVMSNMHLMASSLGIGSCWIQNRLREAPDGRSVEEYLRDLLGFPEDRHAEAILSMGIPAEAPAARELADIDMTKVHVEKY